MIQTLKKCHLLAFGLLLFTSCTRPSPPPSPAEILAVLQRMYTAPVPLQTTENSADPDYLATVNALSTADQLTYSFRHFIDGLIAAGDAAEPIDGGYVYVGPYGLSRLQVQSGERLDFQVLSQSGASWVIVESGWMALNGDGGRLDSGSGGGIGWLEWERVGHSVTCTGLNGTDFEIVEDDDRSGHLRIWSNQQQLEIAEAAWTPDGHGWITGTFQSGDW